MVMGVVDYAELTRCHTMNRLGSMDHVAVGCWLLAVSYWLQGGRDEFRGVTDFQRDVCWRQLSIDAVERHDGEVLLVGRLWVVAMRDIDDVLQNVFLDNKPGTSTQSHAFSLSDGVEPVAFVLADNFPCLQLYDVARQLTQIATQVVVVVDLAQEADALRVFALGIDQVLALGNLAHFFLHHVTNRKERLLQLPVVDLCQKVGLVLDRVGAGAEPLSRGKGRGARGKRFV